MKVRSILYIVAFWVTMVEFAQLTGPVWSQTSLVKKQPSIAVTDYEGNNKELNIAVTNAVNAALSKTGRFKVVERQQKQIEDILKRRDIEEAMTDPATRIKIKQLTGASYLVYGTVEQPTETVSRNEDKKGNTTYSPLVEVRIRHVCVELGNGEIWQQKRDLGSASVYASSDYPTESALKRLRLQACENTIGRFIKILVPPAEGKVLGFDEQPGKETTVLVSLGKKDGVGVSDDVIFFRFKELPVPGPNGKPLIRKERIMADIALRKPGETSRVPKWIEIVGRALQVEDDYSLVQLGYYSGGGGLFGKAKWIPALNSRKFALNDVFIEALHKDDLAVLSPRPEHIE